jgi:hypothetical protein
MMDLRFQMGQPGIRGDVGKKQPQKLGRIGGKIKEEWFQVSGNRLTFS